MSTIFPDFRSLHPQIGMIWYMMTGSIPPMDDMMTGSIPDMDMMTGSIPDMDDMTGSP